MLQRWGKRKRREGNGDDGYDQSKQKYYEKVEQENKDFVEYYQVYSTWNYCTSIVVVFSSYITL